MKGLPAETDFVVIGAGLAGLRAAIELAHAGRVLILEKHEPSPAGKTSHTEIAPLSDEEEVILHLQDTLIAGDGICRQDAVKILIDEAVARIEEVIEWGKEFCGKAAALSFESEASYSHSQVLRSARGPVGSEIRRILQAVIRSQKNISVVDSIFCAELLTADNQVLGVSLLSANGMPHEITCSAVMTAAGGLGQIFPSTTNAPAATGDGVAMAFRAGAEISDMEFVQFHPTTLYAKKVPAFLLAQSLLREGGFLRNIEMDRFMAKYHPLAEKAPADVLTRAIVHEMEVSGARDPFVYMDLTHLNPARVQKRFPRIYATCMQHNINITEDLIPVRPAAHFSIGGVRTGLEGKTSLAGLYAAGESAATGVHGANRFPSNAMLEALVFGARAGKPMREELQSSRGAASIDKKAASQNGPVDAGTEDLISQIRDTMGKHLGPMRIRSGMQEAIKILESLSPKVVHPRTRRSYEAANLHATALLVARSALARQESRGAHYRMDCPARDDDKFPKHSVVKDQSVRFL